MIGLCFGGCVRGAAAHLYTGKSTLEKSVNKRQKARLLGECENA
jgi:hypothetical protein